MTLEVRLFGEMELRCAGALLRLPATARSRSLLAYLIVHRKRPHPRERLADLFWPNRPRTKSLRSLSTALWRIRRTLPPGDYILADVHTVQFNPHSDYWLDVEAFEQEIKEARGKAQDTRCREQDAKRKEEGGLNPASCILHLASCVQLYRGDFLEGLYDDWCLEERYRLEGMYLEALERLVTLHERLDQPEAALRYGARLLARDPLREDIHRTIIRLQVRLGNRAEAVRQARRCRAVLRSELGIDLAPETAALCDELLGPVWRRESVEPILPSQVRAAPDPLSRILDHPPFVGREAVWDTLVARWERAAGGEGHLVFVTGEAGIGKSRLVSELGEWVRQRGGWAARAGCYEYERALPHGPLADLLRATLACTGTETLEALPPWQVEELARLAPDQIPHLPPVTDTSVPTSQRQARLFNALTLFLTDLAKRNPLLLILEDLHWAHDSTLAWLHYLARRLPQTPVLALATYRREEIGAQHPLHGLALRLEREGMASRLELPRLSREALSVWMVGADDALVERVYQQTEGNPFFTLETLRALFEAGRIRLSDGRWVETTMSGALPIPASVRQVVRERLDRLSPPTRRMVEVAAVIGRSFDFEVAEQAWGRGEEATLEALDELLHRRLLREEAGPVDRDYAFDHHLVREVIYRELHHRRRQRLHRQVGEAMERLYGARPETAAELAYHFEQAQEAEKALSWLVEAGEQARRGVRRLGPRRPAGAGATSVAAPARRPLPQAEEMRRIGAVLAVPLLIGENLVGILTLGEKGSGDLYTQEDIGLLTTLAQSAALALENARLHEERMAMLRQQLARVTTAQEEERRRIARELHDGVGPTLAGVNIRLRTARKLLERDHHPAAEEVDELAEQIQESIQDLRRLIYDLRPAALDELGLVPALRGYVARYREEQGLEVALALPAGGGRLPAALETALFRIVQEALNNVARHAQARRVEVELAWDERVVTLRVVDDGRGFDPRAAQTGTHVGLWSMRERVKQLGGQFEVESAPGAGTKVKAVIPLGF